MSMLNHFAILFMFFVSCCRAQDRPILRPSAAFNATNDVAALYKAMAGLGTDEKAITDVLCNRVHIERGNITSVYYTTHGKNLEDDLKGDLGGQIQDLAVQLTWDPLTFFVIEMNKNMEGIGADVQSIFEMLMERNKTDMDAINTRYSQYYGYSLQSQIEKKVGGSAKTYLVTMTQGLRDQNKDPAKLNTSLVTKDITDLYDAGQGNIGFKDSVFIEILSARSLLHLRAIMDGYYTKYSQTLESIVYVETSGDFRTVLTDTLEFAKNKYNFYAKILRAAFESLSTKDRILRRVLIVRAEIDLANIKDEYSYVFGRTLDTDIEKNLSGAYQTGMLDLIN